MKDPQKETIEQTQKSIKNRKVSSNIDLEGDVLVNKEDLEVLTNAKYSTNVVKKPQAIAEKHWKMTSWTLNGKPIDFDTQISESGELSASFEAIMIDISFDTNDKEIITEIKPNTMKVQEGTTWKQVKDKITITKKHDYMNISWNVNDDDELQPNQKIICNAEQMKASYKMLIYIMFSPTEGMWETHTGTPTVFSSFEYIAPIKNKGGYPDVRFYYKNHTFTNNCVDLITKQPVTNLKCSYYAAGSTQSYRLSVWIEPSSICSTGTIIFAPPGIDPPKELLN